jgi:hypothetical protein
MIIDPSAVLTAVVTAAIIGGGGWLLVRWTQWGQSWWAALDRNQGVRGIAVIALVSLLLALVALGSLIVSSRLTVQSFGRNGPNPSTSFNPTKDYLDDFTSADDHRDVAPKGSPNFTYCALSYVTAGVGTCSLVKDSDANGGWRIHVTETVHCRVSCFR